MKMVLLFITGLLFNLFQMIYLIPLMCWDVGMFCVQQDKWIWQIDDDELADGLEEMD